VDRSRKKGERRKEKGERIFLLLSSFSFLLFSIFTQVI